MHAVQQDIDGPERGPPMVVIGAQEGSGPLCLVEQSQAVVPVFCLRGRERAA